MSVWGVRGIVWVAIAIALTMVSAATSAAFDRNESLALVLAAAVLAVVTTLWYRRAMPAAEAREEARQADQLATFKQRLALTREPIAVQASSGVLFLTLLVCITVFCAGTAFARPGVGSILALVFSLFVTVGLGLIYVPRIGKPALTIRPDGIDVSVMGFFGWDEIESIGLQAHTSRGATTHTLDLYVPRLRDREGRLHPLQRLARRAFLRGGGDFVVIQLLHPSLPPALVHALCYDLWKQATGRNKTWTSAISPKHIQDLRRGDEQLEALERIGDLAQTDPVEAMKRLEELQTRFPAEKPPPQKPLSTAAAKRRDALLADLRTIDARDGAATNRVLQKHANAYAREFMTKLVIGAVVLAALGALAAYFLS